MPIIHSITAISKNYLDIDVILNRYFPNINPPVFIGIFYPSGESISPHRLRCSPFAVVYYSVMGHFLASFNARVGWRVLTRE